MSNLLLEAVMRIGIRYGVGVLLAIVVLLFAAASIGTGTVPAPPGVATHAHPVPRCLKRSVLGRCEQRPPAAAAPAVPPVQVPTSPLP